MDGMDMGDGGGGSGPLRSKGVDFSNATQAAEFLEALLNDDELKITGSAYARYFWYGIAVAVAVAAIVNLVQITTLRSRLKAAAQTKDKPSRPQNVIMKCIATITAIARESTYLQITPTRGPAWLRMPPMGTITLVLAHFAFVMTLEFANNNVAGAQFWQARGVRAGWLAIAQLPLLIVLVGKYNIISLLSGVSYERLNVLHRWTSRIMLFLAILHFGYQSYGWQKFGLMTLEWNTDECPPTGIAAFALLLWMNLSTLAPLRCLSYEFFVVQHLITYFGFIIAVMMHLPNTALNTRIYVFVPIAIWFLDRCIQGAMYLYYSINASATISALEGGATKIRLSSKTLNSWPPGSFVLLSVPRYGLVQSHPATIVSTPRSRNGEMVLMLKCQKGFTKRLLTAATNSSTALLSQSEQEKQQDRPLQATTYRAFVHGPYGGSQSDFGAFDSICLLAGSTGVTFTLALLQDLADRAEAQKPLALRRINFVWCVKSSSWARWCNEEISVAFERLRGAGIEVDISIYVTCADAFTEQSNEPKECGCACDKSLGPCCCVLVDESEEGAKSEGPVEQAASAKGENATVTERSSSQNGQETHLQILPCASFYSGRPDVAMILTDLLENAGGESAIAVCGPVAMSSSVRNIVVRLSDDRAIHKGSGAQGCYLHVESFS